MGFGVYIVRRAVLFVVVVLGVMALTFVITHVLPMDPIRALVGITAPPSVVTELRDKYGLNAPVYVQFIRYFENVFRGNLGVSILTGKPVWTEIKRLLPATLELSFLGSLFALGGGILVGAIGAVRKNSVLDRFLRTVSLLGISVPAFWLGLLAILIFSVRFPVFPAGGRLDFGVNPPPFVTGFYTIDSLLAGNLGLFWDAMYHLLLPAIVIGVQGAAWISRHTRSSLLEISSQDYVTAARAKGLSETAVFFRHTFRNGLIPPITIAGLIFGYSISSAIPVEIVFSYDGLGQYAYTSALGGDYNAIVAVALLMGVSFCAVNLAVDLLYGVIDPRIEYG